MKALLWGPPSVLIKRPGVLLTLPLRGHCPVVFLAVSLRGRGSKLVTVSFCLQSRAFSSCWGGGGLVPSWGKEELPHPPKLPLSWFTDSREKQGGWSKLSFSTHVFHYKSLVLILTHYLYPYLSDPSQMFHICFYEWFCERNQLSQRTLERLKLIGSRDRMSNKITKTKALVKYGVLNKASIIEKKQYSDVDQYVGHRLVFV